MIFDYSRVEYGEDCRMADVMTVEELEHEKPKTPSGPSRHAKIMRGIVTPVFGLIAVVCIVFGVLNATIWSPSVEITAKTQVSDSRYIITDPGVLGLVDDNVSVTVQGSDSASTVCVATGSAKDVSGWLSGESYVRITGMSNWTALSTAEASAQGESAEGDNDVAFENSDMWTSVECGEGTVTLNATDEDSTQIAIIDLGEDATDASISMYWFRTEVPDFAMPLYFVGGLCIVLAVLSATVFAMPASKRRNKRVVQGQSTADDATHENVDATTVVPSAAGDATGEITGVTEAAGTEPATGGASTIPTRTKRRRRHARHSGGQSTVPEVKQTGTTAPVVVDFGARNMVANPMATGASNNVGDATGSGTPDAGTSIAATTPSSGATNAHTEAENTTVISQDELAAYFARLAQESPEIAGQSTQDSSSSDIGWGYGTGSVDSDNAERRS